MKMFIILVVLGLVLSFVLLINEEKNLKMQWLLGLAYFTIVMIWMVMVATNILNF